MTVTLCITDHTSLTHTDNILLFRNLALLVTHASSSRGSLLCIITGVGIFAALPDPGAILPEQERDPTARQRHEEQNHARPLVPTARVHLFGEEHDGRTPETADKGLGGKGAGGLVLVRVDEVVVGRVVQKDEAEPDGEAANGRTDPVYVWVRGPGEDEKAHRDEPTRAHHRDQAVLGGGFAVEAGRNFEVVLVDEGGAEGRGDNAEGKRNLFLMSA